MYDNDDAMKLLTLFRSCKEASDLITRIETEMYNLKLLSYERKPEPLMKIERTLYELASDPQVTGGVLYAISISFQQPETGRRKTKY